MFTLPATEDMTLQDWMRANNYMTKSAFGRLKRKAELGGIEIPAVFRTARGTRVTFETLSEAAQYQRVQNDEALMQFNTAVERWARKVEGELKASAMMNFGHREKTNALQPRLADSIKASVRKDQRYLLEAKSIGFSMARHGVFLQKGAGAGQGGYKGSKWLSRKMEWMTTNPKSIGKMDSGNRQAVDWFNAVIDRNMEELIGIVADYSLDIIVTKGGMLIN